MTISRGLTAVALAGTLGLAAVPPATTQARQRNVILFVADGLRHGSINERDTPALWRIRTEGVHFENSHSLFPTFTTANASAMATGHGLGDTGDFSNTLWVGYPTFDSGNFDLGAASPVPFLENDRILSDLHEHLGGNYLGSQTLLDAAAAHGYNIAAIGKLGPTAIFSPATLAAVNSGFPPPGSAMVVDDATGTANGPALPPRLIDRLNQERLSLEAPARTNGYGPTSPYNNGNAGTYARPGTRAPNVVQQQWFLDVATRAVLPLFAGDAKPFALVFWSREPDGSQHNHGDSLGKLEPGINGPTSGQGVQTADRALGQLLAWLDAHPAVKAATDVFVTSDHGFATISRREIDRDHVTASEAAKHDYIDATGTIDTAKGMLPQGFLAIDLSRDLRLPLFDPDRRSEGTRAPYHRVQLTLETWEHPVSGNGLIGSRVLKADGSDATAIVAANGGADLIYVPDRKPETVTRIVDRLLRYDYVAGVFVDDTYGTLPGTLPLSAIGLAGATKMPRPAIVVAFKVFYTGDDLQTAVQIADTTLQQGQGMHGGFGRESTYNNMAAIGPDFKPRFVDPAPVSNADIAPTLARIMGFELPPGGPLRGRVMEEAIAGGPAAPAVRSERLRSPAANGVQLLLQYQTVGASRYLDSSCLVPADRPTASCR
jgi:Type I phosphodiesterase / nucleotide pyrophosphatase